MNISHFIPDETVKTCLVYLNGTYPPKNGFYVEKDLNLPARLYPNAEFYIRCNTSDKRYMKNMRFFKKLYKGRKIKFLDDSLAYDKLNVDVIWFIHFNFIFFGGKIDKYTFCKWIVTQNSKSKIHILFNEEGTPTFEPLWDYIQRRNENFHALNKEYISLLKDKTDWSNVTLLCNEDRIAQWVNDRPVQKCLDGGINISYLTDKILYDLPSASPDSSIGVLNKGIYIGKFSPKRLSYFNKNFISGKLDILMIGPDSDKLTHHTGTGESIDNKEAKELMASGTYSYSIYIGKGTPSCYLGATFYEPLLNGLPLFVWKGTDPEMKIFPGHPEFYFNNEDDLAEKIDNMTLMNFDMMFENQIKLLEL